MKTKYFLFGMALAATLSSCKKDCDKDPVETEKPCTAWGKLLGGTHTDLANAGVKTPDGGYLVVGSTQSNDGDVSGYHGGIDILVFKVDKDGVKVWQKAFGGSGQDIANAVIAAPDGGYVIAGYTMSSNGDVVGRHGEQDAWILKINEVGTILWQKAWGGTRNEMAFAAAAAADGYVVAIGSASTDGDLPATNTHTNTWLVKFNTNGTIGWQKPVGVDNVYNVPSNLIATTGGYVVVGSTGNGTGADARVVKTSTTGDIIWEKTFSGTDQDEFSGITESADGGYLLTGFTASNDGDIIGNTRGDFDVLAVKVNSNGGKEWLKIYEGSGVDGLNKTSVAKTVDGQYMVAAFSSGNGTDAGTNHGGADAWILKLNASGVKVGQKLLGGTENDYVGQLIKANDCGYLLIGSSFSNNGDVSGNHSNGFSDVWLFKINDF
ncbi:MAG TPA: hypothetical protein VD794_16660 [Flavisolibacter sp.]|nr:hypothetical protein [Flavisolibacter sp.]